MTEKPQASNAPQTPKAEASEEKLPLVIQVIPGQAREGLMTMFPVGKWEAKNLSDLVEEAMSKEHNVEDREVLNKIHEQMGGGGKLLYEGKEIHSNPLDYAKIEKTETGERYYYIELKAIKPQEGGRGLYRLLYS